MKRGRKSIPCPVTPEQASAIAIHGELGADPWMQYLQGNPYLHSEAMKEALSRGNGSVRLEDLQAGWARRFGDAIGKALAVGDIESVEGFAKCARAVLSKYEEPFSDPSGYDIACNYLFLCWTENRPIDKAGFVAYCKKSPVAHHRFMPERNGRQVDRLLKWSRAALKNFPPATTL